jgi:hypothetical protein
MPVRKALAISRCVPLSVPSRRASLLALNMLAGGREVVYDFVNLQRATFDYGQLTQPPMPCGVAFGLQPTLMRLEALFRTLGAQIDTMWIVTTMSSSADVSVCPKAEYRPSVYERCLNAV